MAQTMHPPPPFAEGELALAIGMFFAPGAPLPPMSFGVREFLIGLYECADILVAAPPSPEERRWIVEATEAFASLIVRESDP
jgi:hypothetical protein